MNVPISSFFVLRSSYCAVIREKHKDFSSVSFVNSVNNHPEGIVSLLLFGGFFCKGGGGVRSHSSEAGLCLKCDFLFFLRSR